MAKLSATLLAAIFCGMFVMSFASHDSWAVEEDEMDDNDFSTDLSDKDWRIAGCKSKSATDRIFTSCAKCVSNLPDDNMDFGCFDWCAKFAKDVGAMETCTGCLVNGFTKKKYNPFYCSECVKKSKGDSLAHDMCVQCLNDGTKDYYCSKALDVIRDKKTIGKMYECLYRAQNKNLALEDCINYRGTFWKPVTTRTNNHW